MSSVVWFPCCSCACLKVCLGTSALTSARANARVSTNTTPSHLHTRACALSHRRCQRSRRRRGRPQRQVHFKMFNVIVEMSRYRDSYVDWCQTHSSNLTLQGRRQAAAPQGERSGTCPSLAPALSARRCVLHPCGERHCRRLRKHLHCDGRFACARPSLIFTVE